MPGMLRKSTAFVPRYQKFESISLQWRVLCEPDFQCREDTSAGPSSIRAAANENASGCLFVFPRLQRRYAFSSFLICSSPCNAKTSATEAISLSTPAIPTGIANGRCGASGRVPAAEAERPLSVQSGDLRGDAGQRAKRAEDRDRGTPRGATPPTPPGIRVTYHGGST